MKQKFTIDDVLLIAFLSLTIWHSAHILAVFEIIGELAWLLAFGVDVGIARAAWVSSNRNLSSGARWIAAGWLSFLLASSYGLNVAYYAERHANFWAWALASLFPVSIAAAGAVKSFLANRQAETVTPAPVPDNSTEEIDTLQRLLSSKDAELNGTRLELEQVTGNARDIIGRMEKELQARVLVSQPVEATIPEEELRNILRAVKNGNARGGYGQDEAVEKLRALFNQQTQ